MEEIGSHTCSNESRRQQDGNDNLYFELWRACAGPFVTIPCVGEKVFYFPQGHVEMFDAHMVQDGVRRMLNYNLSSKILCRVVDVKLKAEPDTDEVFAVVILLPISEQEEITSGNETTQTTASKQSVVSVTEILTTSDTSMKASFSILSRHAEELLPPLDMTKNPPTQNLVAKDLHGVQWGFRHVYCGQPKRHRFSTGWSKFINVKKPVAGDAFILVRDESRELCVGIRHAGKPQNLLSSSIISVQSMVIGVLATAYHSITTRTTFGVIFWPRISVSEFIVPYNQYMESIKINYSVGMRFWMRFEGEDGNEERSIGVITDVDDADPIAWPDSKWRCLKVEWVENAAIARPERVSPWEIMPFPVAACGLSATSSPKRRWTVHSQFVLESSTSRNDGHHEVSHGQEKITCMPLMANNNTNWIQELGLPVPITVSQSISKPFIIFGVGIPRNHLAALDESGGSGNVNAQMRLMHPVTARNSVKVHRQGNTVKRLVSLSRSDGYKDLADEPDRMSEFEGSLVEGSRVWNVIHADAEEDITMLGDCEWLEFLSMVQRRFSYPRDAVEKSRTSAGRILEWRI